MHMPGHCLALFFFKLFYLSNTGIANKISTKKCIKIKRSKYMLDNYTVFPGKTDV